MQIRPVTPADLDALEEIDGTVDSNRYLFVERSGEGLGVGWRIEERPLRTKLVAPNRLDDEQRFAVRQIASGADEGIALLAEHEDQPVALLTAVPRPARGVMELLDLRIDFEHRRQGVATAMMYQMIAAARDQQLRGVAAESRTNNFPANALLAKLGFELAGLDLQRYSNHDLVKEAVTLFWNLAIE